jgi:hypothetical protein
MQQITFAITWLKCTAMVLQVGDTANGVHKFDKYILIAMHITFKRD